MPQVLSVNDETGEVEIIFSEEEKSAIFNKAMNEMFAQYIKEEHYNISSIASRIFVFRDIGTWEFKILNITTEDQYQQVIKIIFKYMENGGWFEDYMEDPDTITSELQLAFDGDFNAMESIVNQYRGDEGLNWWIQEFELPDSFDHYLNEDFDAEENDEN